jgi:hypothetical protein
MPADGKVDEELKVPQKVSPRARRAAPCPSCRRRPPARPPPPPPRFNRPAPRTPPRLQVQVGSSPVYYAGRRLGKGGFGQVFLGTRAGKARSSLKDPKPSEVALKYEHKTSRGCTANGPPYEWGVYT